MGDSMTGRFMVWDWDRCNWLKEGFEDTVELNWYVAGDEVGQVFVDPKHRTNVDVVYWDAEKGCFPCPDDVYCDHYPGEKITDGQAPLRNNENEVNK